VLGTIEITLLWHGVLIAVAEGMPPLAPSWFPDLGASVVNLVCALVIWTLLRAWGMTAGVTTLGRRWWLVAPLLLIALTYALPGIEGSTAALVGSAVSLALVGVNEELYSRGLSLQVARPLGALPAATLVAVLFGAGHLQNYLLFGKPLDDTLFQILAAGLYGFCLAGVRLRIGTVWPLVFVHGLDDWLQVNSPGAAPDWWQLTVLAFHLGYGFVLLLRTRRDERA
jgi:CAAX protease family protein